MASHWYGKGRKCANCGRPISPTAKELCRPCVERRPGRWEGYKQDDCRPETRDRVEYYRGRASAQADLFTDPAALPPLGSVANFYWRTERGKPDDRNPPEQ